MAILTLRFNDKAIQSVLLYDVLTIGRNEYNDLQIDSLAIAPRHARISKNEQGQYSVESLNPAFPLLVNDEETTNSQLQAGDRIDIGKHSLLFSHETADDSPESRNSSRSTIPEASLQLMTGKHIGRIIPLKSKMNQVGKSGHGLAMITRRKIGYVLSALENEELIQVNKEVLGNKSLVLEDGDQLELDKTCMQFYLNR